MVSENLINQCMYSVYSGDPNWSTNEPTDRFIFRIQITLLDFLNFRVNTFRANLKNMLNTSFCCHQQALLDATSACRRFFDFEDLPSKKQRLHTTSQFSQVFWICEDYPNNC